METIIGDYVVITEYVNGMYVTGIYQYVNGKVLKHRLGYSDINTNEDDAKEFHNYLVKFYWLYI